MDSILKLVYSDWCNTGTYKEPIPNGVHSALVKYIQAAVLEHKTLGEVQQEVESENNSLVFVHDHGNFIGYHRKYHHESTLVTTEDIVDDNSIYLYPVEIRTTLDSLFNTMDFVLDGQKYEYSFKNSIPSDVISLLKSGKVKLLINYLHEPMASNEDIYFTNIENKMNELGIDGSNIIVVGGNRYNHPTSKFKFTDGGILIGQQTTADTDSYPKLTALGYVSDIVRESDLNKNKIRNKRFLCFNRTMKSHRFMIAYLALKYNLLENSIFSFINLNGFTTDGIYHWLTFYLGDVDNLREISSTIHDFIPYEIDTHHLSVAEKQGFGNENSKKELYLDTYLHLTSETKFDTGDDPFFSEKTYRPLMNLQPFIYIGNHHALEKLHNMGFKTFYPYINEDYDLEEDPKKRMAMIAKEIEIFNNKPISEIHRWYYSIIDVLVHNQNHLKTIKNINPFEKVYFDIRGMYE